jgi:8-oxo-dGTP diphosphatase
MRKRLAVPNACPTPPAFSGEWADESDIAQLASEADAIRILDAVHTESTPAVRHHDGRHLL